MPKPQKQNFQKKRINLNCQCATLHRLVWQTDVTSSIATIMLWHYDINLSDLLNYSAVE